jgi:3-mercaptopyruvate sulfurtransferase SseA
MNRNSAIGSIMFVLLFFVCLGNSFAIDIPKRISDVKRITVAEVKQLQQQENIVIVDTRAPGQWIRAKDKAPGAKRVQSHDDLARFKLEVPRDKAIVTYCT